MDAERWQRLETLFFAALETPPPERTAWLDHACAGDAELRAELDAVLAAHLMASQAEGARRVGRPGDGSAPADAMIGTRIGPYQLDQRIGHGGMGVVYRAHRVDEQYHREVAIKLVRSGHDADEMTRRFRVERQILANLQHPNIATLLEGGVTQDGQPYLVMPYVPGVPITDYADTHALRVADRLRLFRTVCDAVQYAHANLVVHRDLKPSNILVTDDGDVRLLDFGIAKLLAPEDAGVTAVLTTDAFLLTPEHAAPEQLQRKPVTTATDVYALGVLLYELLTGVRPFRAGSQIELYRAICEDEPKRPSEISRQLPGDLDHILLMALRKEPERRYASAGQLAEDVTRFLEGRTVLARPDAVGYRARRFVGRNRTAVSLAGIAAVLLIAGLIGTASQARRARAEATQAAADRDRAERVSALLVDVFRLSDPETTRGRTITAREVLAEGAARIVRDLDGQPEPQADLLIQLGRIYENLGLFDEASAQVEHAVELRRSLHGERHPRVAEALTDLARIRILQQRADEGMELARNAVSTLRQNGSERDPHPALPDALLALGAALRAASAPAETAETYTAALSLLERQPERDHAAIAEATFGLADAAHSQGQFDLADSLLEQTIERFARLGGPPQPDAAKSLHDLGMLRLFRRQIADAERLLRRALEMRRRIYGRVHPAVAETLVGLAHSLSLLGRFPDAVSFAEAAVTVSDSTWGRNHTRSADARVALGFTLLHVDEGERAVQLMREALAVQSAQRGEQHPQVIGAEVMIAQAHASMGRFEQARGLFVEALRHSDAALGPRHAYRAHILFELARLDFDAGRLDDAEAKAREAIALASEVLRPDHRFALWATTVVAQVQAARGRLASADSLLRSVLGRQQATVGTEHPETARTLVMLADIETRLGRSADAERRARVALAIYDTTRDQGAGPAEARSVLGGALAAQGRITEAEPLLRAAVDELSRARGARPSQIAAATERLHGTIAAPPSEH